MPANVADTGLIPGLENPLEKEMAAPWEGKEVKGLDAFPFFAAVHSIQIENRICTGL